MGEEIVSFGEWMQIRRESLRLTRKQLADRVGCSPVTIKKIERDERRPSVQIAELLAEHLQIPEGERGDFVRRARGEYVPHVDAPDKIPLADTQTLKASRHNLPSQTTSFIGREDELAALKDLIANPAVRLIAIVGPGGIGKTRLSIQVAGEALEAFSDGAYFVPLAPINSPGLLISAIADALNLTISGAADPKTQLLNFLRRRSLLLILDNFEHLIDRADLLSEIVAATPGSKLLVSSRERLNLREEWVFELGGLSFPIAAEQSQDGPYGAVQLFQERASQIRRDFDLAVESPHVIRICQLVNGMPLGLELAASWLKVMAGQDIVDEIERNLDFLATTMRNVPPRHRSLRAVFQHSWQLLSGTEKRVFKKLSLFRGGFSREAGEQVAGATLPVLSALVDKSLLGRSDAGRYEIHELLRQYAAEELEETPDERDASRAAHASYFADFLQQCESDLRGSRQKEALAKVTADIDNVRASWNWAVEQKAFDLLGKSVESLHYFSEMRGRVREAETAFREAVTQLTESGSELTSTIPTAHKIVLGRLMNKWGVLTPRLGRWEEGYQQLHQGVRLLRTVEHGAERYLASSLGSLALVTYSFGEHDKAKTMAEEALGLATAAGDKVEVAWAYNVMGHLAEFQGEYASAGPLFAESIRHDDEIGERWLRAYAQNNWGRAAYAMGEYAQAEALIQAAIAVRREFGDLIGLGYSLLDLGNLARMQGQYKKATNHIQEALDIVSDIGVNDSMARCYHGLGMVAEAKRDFAEAEAFHQKSLDIYRVIKVRRALPMTFNHLARTAYERGDYQLAEQRLHNALMIGDELKNRGERASTLRHLGHLAIARGEFAGARDYFRQALEILAQTGARPVALDVLLGWAESLMRDDPSEDDWTQAIELLTLGEHHPASEHQSREKARQLKQGVGDKVSPDLMAKAAERGREIDLETTSRQLIEMFSGSANS